MKTPNPLTSVACIVIGAGLLLAGCSAPNSAPKDESFPPPSATSTAPNPEETPSPDATPSVNIPDFEARIDTADFVMDEKIKGLKQEDIDAVLEVSKEFALEGFSPKFLNGNWVEEDMKTIAKDFSPYITPTVLAALESIDLKDPESANSLASIAALLSPTDKISATNACKEETAPTEKCLRADLVLSKPAFIKDEGRIVVSFNATTTRDLLLEEAAAQSDVTIRHTLTFEEKKGDWLIDGINNTFLYGKVEAAKEE